MQESDSTVGKVLRGLEVFFPFINLCILIAQAAFQSKWNVGLSARVILSILVCTLGLFYSGLVRKCLPRFRHGRFDRQPNG